MFSARYFLSVKAGNTFKHSGPLSSAEVIMIIKCQVLVFSLLFNISKATFPRVLKPMAQPTRSSQRTSAEERDSGLCSTTKVLVQIDFSGAY